MCADNVADDAQRVQLGGVGALGASVLVHKRNLRAAAACVHEPVAFGACHTVAMRDPPSGGTTGSCGASASLRIRVPSRRADACP
jgi:hypothetical protein